MPLTREFKDTVMARLQRDPEFRTELIVEATNAFLDDDVETGKALLRDYLNASELMPEIAKELGLNEKSIRRMLGPSGNPTLKNFARLLKACSKVEHIKLEVCSR
jgi:DNA-binding phage protein